MDAQVTIAISTWVVVISIESDIVHAREET